LGFENDHFGILAILMAKAIIQISNSFCWYLKIVVFLSFLFLFFSFFLACRDDCPESYCHDPGVSVSVTPQGKYFYWGYIF
jgi:hypothetical protein